MTSRISLSSLQIRAILPGLEQIVNGVADLRTRPQWNLFEELRSNKRIYQNHLFDQEMYEHALTCRNKLKSISRSGKVRLNAFEIAAAALALRWVLKQRLASDEVINAEAVAALPHKLELHRKRAKRGCIRRLGIDGYSGVATRWRLFTQWLRLKVLFSPQQRRISLSCLSMLKKEQRETIRQLVKEVVVDSTSEADLRRWAELARWEIWKGRHGTTLREFLSDHVKARLFLADFILKRAEMRTLRIEFLPPCLRLSLRASDFSAALLSVPDSATSIATARSFSGSLAIAPTDSLRATGTPATVSIPEPSAASSSEPQMTATKEDLVSLLSTWFVNEVDPGYYRDVAAEIGFQIRHFSHNHQTAVNSTNPTEVIEECRPTDTGLDSRELVAYLAGWAAKWLLALNADPFVVRDAVGEGLSAARTYAKSLSPMTYQGKISEIHHRYFA